MTENLRWFDLKINGKFAFDINWDENEIIEMHTNDIIKITKISKYYTIKPAVLIIEGIDWTTVYDERKDEIKSEDIVIK